MNYKLEGNGETLVFIHGLSDNLLYWEYLASNLKNDYQILRVDLRGHGNSGLGNDEISIDTYVDDLFVLLDELNLEKINLVGFSLGGAVALAFTIKYPSIVSSLVLMSSFCKTDDYLEGVFNRFKNALKSSFEDFYDLILPMILCPDVIENNKEELKVLREITSQSANVKAYIEAFDACLAFNVEDDLSKIDIQTLVLAGKYDDITLMDSQKNCKVKLIIPN